MTFADRMRGLPQTNKQRLVADLPPEVQLNAINSILAGQNSTNQFINNFVRQGAAQGKNAEQIRQEFITHQRQSPSPLIIM